MNRSELPLAHSPPVLPRPGRSKLLWWWQWFWRVNLLISIVIWLPYAWYCFYVPANGIPWGENFASAQEDAAVSGKPMILFFTGKWCVPCRIMKRTVWADEEVTALVKSGFIAVALDVDDPDAAAIKSRYGVGSTPDTIITDALGEVLLRKTGRADRSEFVELLTKLNAGGTKLVP